MISAWWLVPAVIAGGVFGVLLAALCAAGRKGNDE